MELRDFLKLLRIEWQRVASAIIAFALLGLLFSFVISTHYEATLDIYVHRQPSTFPTEVYDYDGYYAQLSSRDYADVTVGFLKSRSIVKKTLEELNRPAQALGVEKVLKALDARKTATNVVLLTVNSSLPQDATDLSKSLVETAAKRLALLTAEDGQQVVSVELLDPEPLIKKVEPNVPLNILVGALVGLLFGLGWVSLREYLR